MDTIKKVKIEPSENNVMNKAERFDNSSGGINSIKFSSLLSAILGRVQKNLDVNNVDFEFYESFLNKVLDSSKTYRSKVTMAGLFLATVFPKIPYFLDFTSGHDGRDLKGLSWIKDAVERDDGSTGNRTLDCSGFINWCLVNAGLDYPGYGTTNDYYNWNKVTHEDITSLDAINNTKPGDLAYTNGHIGIVLNVKKDTNEIVVAHSSNSNGGMGITTIKVGENGGCYTKNDAGEYESTIDETTNGGVDQYFTEILHVNYE